MFHKDVPEEILQERAVSSRNRRNPRGVKRKMRHFPLRPRDIQPLPPINLRTALKTLEQNGRQPAGSEDGGWVYTERARQSERSISIQLEGDESALSAGRSVIAGSHPLQHPVCRPVSDAIPLQGYTRVIKTSQ
jgi:hypothetical protein